MHSLDRRQCRMLHESVSVSAFFANTRREVTYLHQAAWLMLLATLRNRRAVKTKLAGEPGAGVPGEVFEFPLIHGVAGINAKAVVAEMRAVHFRIGTVAASQKNVQINASPKGSLEPNCSSCPCSRHVA